jgi:hypothetical protein
LALAGLEGKSTIFTRGHPPSKHRRSSFPAAHGSPALAAREAGSTRLFTAPAVAMAVALGTAAVSVHANAAIGLLAAPRAQASSRKNIAIGRVEGPNSSKIRLALMQRLKDSSSFTVTDAEDLKSTSGRSTIAKMAAALQVDAVVLGSISNNSNLTLSVYKSDGRLVEQVKVKGGSKKKLEQAIQDEFDDTVAPSLARASGARTGRAAAAAPIAEEEEEPVAQEARPAPEEPESEEPKQAEPAPEDETAAEAEEAPSEPKADESKKSQSKPGRTALELDLGMRFYARDFEYTGQPRGVRDPTVRRTLAPYHLPAAPAVLFSGILYPGAFFSDGVLGNIGVMGRFELGFGTSTDYELTRSDGSKVVTTLKTKAQAWDLGLRGRIPLGPAEIALFAEYGMQTFILLGDEGGAELSPLVPDVQYKFVRLGAEPRVRIGKLTLGAHIAPRVLTSLHDIDLPFVWFPNAKGWGIDWGFMAGYGVTSFLDIVAGADFVGYGFDFNDLPIDPKIAPVLAGGATDRYKSLWFALRFRIGGQSQ